jgi:hypothetical protein
LTVVAGVRLRPLRDGTALEGFAFRPTGGERVNHTRMIGVALLFSVGLLLPIASSAVADQPQSVSSYPEVPAGNSPQPNGNGGGSGGNGVNCNTSTSACPEVPAGANPQPNGN